MEAPNRPIAQEYWTDCTRMVPHLRTDKGKRLSYLPDMDSEEIIALFVFGFFASAIIFGLAAFVL
jgi:hypothetical protein